MYNNHKLNQPKTPASLNSSIQDNPADLAARVRASSASYNSRNHQDSANVSEQPPASAPARAQRCEDAQAQTGGGNTAANAAQVVGRKGRNQGLVTRKEIGCGFQGLGGFNSVENAAGGGLGTVYQLCQQIWPKRQQHRRKSSANSAAENAAKTYLVHNSKYIEEIEGKIRAKAAPNKAFGGGAVRSLRVLQNMVVSHV